MNVGSILNNDSPPNSKEETSKDGEIKTPKIGSAADPSGTPHQRHSIVNMLNDPPKQFSKPISPTIHKNNILNITNDKDVDLSTGEETTNISRKSSISGLDTTQEGETIKETKKSVTKASSPKLKEVKQAKNDPLQIKDELRKIKNIKSKARRYTTPPIWAQEYRSKGKEHSNGVTHQETVLSPNTHLSDKRVLNNTITTSVDLECSVLGVIPTSSMIKTISSWIFANFKNIAEENRQHVELELKFGRIIDKEFGKRVKLDITSDCVYTNHTGSSFDMQIDELAWLDVQKFFSELESTYQSELKRLKNIPKKPTRKFNTLDSDMTDLFYQITERNAKSKSVRVSKDNTLNPPRYVAISKTRIGDLYIYNPLGIYDLRLSLSLELPVSDDSIDNIRNRNTPRLIREKKRSSWVHAPTITRFDLTRVLMPLESKNKSGKTIVTHEKKYEVELEIDTAELFSAIEKVDKGIDMYRFQELVEIFMNNARVLNNRVSSLARGD